MLRYIAPDWLRPWLAQLPPQLLSSEFLFVDAAQATAGQGQSASRQGIQAILESSFSETLVTLHTIHITLDTLTLDLTFSGCHSGVFAGIPPTHRPVYLPIAITCCLRDGRVHQATLDYDAGELLKQLGFVI